MSDRVTKADIPTKNTQIHTYFHFALPKSELHRHLPRKLLARMHALLEHEGLLVYGQLLLSTLAVRDEGLRSVAPVLEPLTDD
jgi:hypothetical protein